MIESVVFNESGLIPVITQDTSSKQILMFAWMNRDALEATVSSGRAVYYSRSRQKLWPKGDESGHVQLVRGMRLDCDGDVLLMSVEQIGGIACHTGRAHCFYRELAADGQWQETDPVLRDPADIYKKKRVSTGATDIEPHE